MKKIILQLILASAAALQAENHPYTSDWSAFDSGHNRSGQSALAHTGQLSGWFAHPLHSADYSAQEGQSPIPAPEPLPGVPLLTMVRVGGHVRVSWPLSAQTILLEETEALDNKAWAVVAGPYSSEGPEQFVLLPASSPSRFFRLTAGR